MENEKDKSQIPAGDQNKEIKKEEPWIERTLEKLDEEFPLSGAEDDDDLTFWEEDDTKKKDEKEKE